MEEKPSKNAFRIYESLEEDLSNNFGNWELQNEVSIVYKGNANIPKKIPMSDLAVKTNLTDMLGKFQEKGGEDGVNFYFAYLAALRDAGYKTLTIDLSNNHKISVK